MLADFPYLEALLSSCIVHCSANPICWPVLLFCSGAPGMLPVGGYCRGGPWDYSSRMVLVFGKWDNLVLSRADSSKLVQPQELVCCNSLALDRWDFIQQKLRRAAMKPP